MAAPDSQTTALKILTVGPAVGALRDLFAKVKAINAKHGKFDLVLCVGDFFGPVDEEGVATSAEVKELLAGTIEVPLECYVMQGEHALPTAVIEKYAKTGGDLCKNVFLLSKSAIVTTPHGLRIACLGGVYEPHAYATAEAPLGFTSPHFSSQTLDKLLSNASASQTSQKGKGKGKDYTSLAAISAGSAPSQLVDVLVTNVWPSSITQFSSLPSPELSSGGAAPVDVLARATKPRYLFSAGLGQPRVFWEREPFVWDDEQGRVSRFVSLGAFGGDPGQGKKQRWFYAFSIAPVAPDAAPAPRPPNSTRNPFSQPLPGGQKRPHNNDAGENYIWGNVPQGKRPRTMGQQDKPPPGYQCKQCKSNEHFITDCPERAIPPEDYICKICSNPGHFVRDCPTKHQLGDTGGRKPRPGYVCRACGSEGHYIEDCSVANARPERRRGPPKEISPDECWFCLSNPNLAKHLIVAVGSECYVTLPKGQIMPTHEKRDSTTPVVPGGGHVLMVPIAHYPTLASLSPDIADSVLGEVDSHKTALRALYAKCGAAGVFFEMARLSAKGGHAHVQAVPIPLALQDKVEEAFLGEARALGVTFEADPDAALASCAEDRRGYFRVDLPDGRKMVHILRDHAPFSIQFGRQVLTAFLGMGQRMDWKSCAQSEEEDKEDAAAFKAAFAPFDPSQ